MNSVIGINSLIIQVIENRKTYSYYACLQFRFLFSSTSSISLFQERLGLPFSFSYVPLAFHIAFTYLLSCMRNICLNHFSCLLDFALTAGTLNHFCSLVSNFISHIYLQFTFRTIT